MSDALLIQANLREKVGTGSARNLRNAGYVPAVVYGKGEASKLITISHKEAETLYHASQIRSAIVNIKVENKSYDVFPKQFSLHPVTDIVEHIDFMFAGDKTTELRMNIPVKIKGKDQSIGVKKGGVVNIVSRSLICKVVKEKVPPYIEVDISDMDVGVTVRLKDIVLPDGVKLMIKDLNQTFLRLTGKRKVVEEAEIQASTAEGEAGAAAETATEGAEAATKGAKESEAKTGSAAGEKAEKKDKK